MLSDNLIFLFHFPTLLQFSIKLTKFQKMLKITLLIFLSLTLALSTPSQSFIKLLAIKHKAVAAWVLDSADPTHYTNDNDVMRFTDLVNNLPLKRGGANALSAGNELYKGKRIPYVDFSNTDTTANAGILFSRSANLDLSSSFTIVTVYKKLNENGFRNGGFLAGKWEECDRSRSYALFGELFGKNCITSQSSNTGFASPSDCTYAWEGICGAQIPNANDDSLWHTAAMLWKANPLGDDSKENETQCPLGADNYECGSDVSKCSYIQSYIDAVPGPKKYYKYRKTYQGTAFYFDQQGQQTSIQRKALFTVGGTAARHWKQPDHRENGRMVGDITLLGNNWADFAKEDAVAGDWTDDFMFNGNGEMEANDLFVRSRYGGLISAVFVLNKAMTTEELRSFNVENLFQ